MFYEDYEKGFELYLEELLENGPFDDHNASQCDYLETRNPKIKLSTIPIDRMNRSIDQINVFIDFDNLEKGIQCLIRNNGFKMNKKFYVSSEIETNRLKKIALQFKSAIKDLYYNDYVLYNSKFGQTD